MNWSFEINQRLIATALKEIGPEEYRNFSHLGRTTMGRYSRAR
jgi:hypothetical protein